MRKKLFVLFFLGFITLCIFLTTNKHLIEQITTYIDNKNEVKSDNKKVSVPAYYSLWKDEQSTKNLLPKGFVEVTKTNENQVLVNNFDGYKINVPLNWEINKNQYTVFTKFYTKDFSLNIFSQDVNLLWITTQKYVDQAVANIEGHHPEKDEVRINGKKFIKYTYSRPIIKNVSQDLNNYAFYFYINDHFVYTFQLKYKENNVGFIKGFEKQLASFKIIHKKKISNQLINEEIKNIPIQAINYNEKKASFKVGIDENVIGIYRKKATDIDNKKKQHYNKIGAHLLYYGLDSPYDVYFENIYKKRRMPIVTLLFKSNKPSNLNINERIISGEFDKNLNDWAKNTKELEYPIMFRLGNEMNGKWEESNSIYSYYDSDYYKLAYRHIVNIFRSNGASNVKFIWNPNGGNDPYFDWNEAQMYYPGDEYVDLIGITVYNFGKTKYSEFKSYNNIYTDVYKDYLLSYGNKPMIIGETGSVEYGGDKSRFIKDLLSITPKLYPNIRMIIYFDSTHDPYDFQINTSDASSEAFINGLNNEHIILGIKKK